MGRVRKWLVCLCMTMSLLVGMAVVPIAAEETTEYCVVTINGNGGQRSNGNEVYVCEGIKIGEPYNIRGWFKKEKAVERSLVLVDGAAFFSNEEDPMCVTFYGNATVKIEWLETGYDRAAIFYSSQTGLEVSCILDLSSESRAPSLPESQDENLSILYWECKNDGEYDVLPGEVLIRGEEETKKEAANLFYRPVVQEGTSGILFCSGDECFSTGSRFYVSQKDPRQTVPLESKNANWLLSWNTEPNGTGIAYYVTEGETVASADSSWVRLYAQWSKENEILVTLYDEATKVSILCAGLAGSTIQIPNLQREGYQFLGWQAGEGKSIYKETYKIPEESSFCMLSAVWEQLLYQPATVICDASSMKICIPAAQTIPETVKRIVLSAYERGRMVCSVTGTLQTDGASQRIVCEVPESLAGESDTWKVFALDDAWSPVLKAEILTFQS